MSTAFYELARPTFLDQWPPALAALSMPSESVTLTEAEARALAAAACADPARATALDHESLVALCGRLDQALERWPGGAFVRLNSRSAKGAFPRGHPMRARDGREALRLLAQGSDRVLADLEAHVRLGWPVSVWLRQWIEISPEREYRLIFRNRRCVAATPLRPHLSLSVPGEGLRSALAAFAERFAAASHLDDVVADVLVAADAASVLLIEVNPYHPATDFVLFDWNDIEHAAGPLDLELRLSGPGAAA